MDGNSFEWPLPNGLTDTEVKGVFMGLTVLAAAYKSSTVDKATDYLAALTQACVSWVEDELDRRGVARGTFDNIEPDDFNEAL